MTFVISDIHGEVTKLRLLMVRLEKMGFEKLIFLGDYMDKGENSKETLQYLSELSAKYDCVFLLGNHEYAWLKYFERGEYGDFILKYGGAKTLIDFKINKLERDIVYRKIYLPHKKFYKVLKKYTLEKDFLISHSGINPELINEKKLDEVDEKEFVFQRYNVINYKGLVNSRRLIFGHTVFPKPFYDGYKIGIDCGAFVRKDSPLVAFELDGEFFIDHMGRKQKLVSIDKEYCSDTMLVE